MLPRMAAAIPLSKDGAAPRTFEPVRIPDIKPAAEVLKGPTDEGRVVLARGASFQCGRVCSPG
jgi:hypothetical protein